MGRPRCGGDEGRAFAHAESLVNLLARRAAPSIEERRAQSLAGREAVAQGRKFGRRELAIFEHLAIERGHSGENCCARRADQLRPDRDVLRAVVKHRGGAGRPGIEEADAERIAPVEGAGVEHDVAGAEPLPVSMHRDPAKH